MLTTESLSGIELSQYRAWAKTFNQFPTTEDIGSMTESTRQNLLAITSQLRVAKIGLEHVPLEALPIFKSIEEELDGGASVEQQLRAAVSWFRQAEMHLFRITPDSTEMMIIPMNSASREIRTLRPAIG